MAKESNPEEKNVATMKASLKQLGITDTNAEVLVNSLKMKPNPYSMTGWVLKDENKIKLDIKFTDTFSIDYFIGTFVPRVPIDHKTVGGIDTMALEEKMKNADWYYAYSESPQQLENEVKKIDSIETEIQQLIKDPEGLRIATMLWNNNVPFYTATKPDEIRAYEIESDLYLTQKFDGKVSIEEAHQELSIAFESGQRNEVIQAKQELPSLMTPGNSSAVIVANDEVQAIKELLSEQQLAGMKWVAFDEGAPVIGQHHLNFFKTEFEVSDFIHENSTDRDFFSDMSIQEFHAQLDKWVDLKNNPDELVPFLDGKMKNADWNYKDADNYERYYQGEKELGQINYLLSLVKQNIGIEKASTLWEQYASIAALPKPNFLNEKNTVMITEQELSQIRRDFGKIGASDAFNPKLTDQLKAGVPIVDHEHPTKNKVSGDEANTTFHLKKSDKSNLYFLNSWKVSVSKFGTEPPVEMTFYNNEIKRNAHVLKNPEKLVTTFSHTRSINYACGRPVLNTYKNQKGRVEQVWDQAFPKERQPNGMIKVRSFHKEYGFDLRKVANEYRAGIKNLSHPEYSERFYQSLERGNLEKTPFVEKDGKENPYYVTPNIQVGYLEVYSTCSAKAEPLTPEQLFEKGFISKEFSVKIRERMNEIESQKQNYKQNKVSENTATETHQSSPDKKQQSISKTNKPKEKISAETDKSKRRLKHKHI